nr:hypothetical protein [Tanacetum cinerariifolium]
MTLLNKLLETCATLTNQVANLEQDKIAQAIEITKLKQRARRLEKKRHFKSSGLKRLRKGGIAELDADEDVTLVDAKKDINDDVHGRLAESQAQVYHLDLQHAEKVLSMQDTDEAEPAEVEEVIKVVTVATLMTEVVTTAAATINWDDVMEQVKRREKQDNTVMRYQALKRKPHYNSIRDFLEKGEKEIEEEGSKRKDDSASGKEIPFDTLYSGTNVEQCSSTDEGWVKFHVKQRQVGYEIKTKHDITGHFYKIEVYSEDALKQDQVIKGSLVVSSSTRRANCVYTLGSQAVTIKTLKARKQLGEYQTQWKINTEDTIMSTYLVNRSPSSTIEFKKPIDMYGFSAGVQGVGFQVEPQEDHTFEHVIESNTQHGIYSVIEKTSMRLLFAVATIVKKYAHESLTFNDIVSCEVISKWKTRLKKEMDAQSDVYVLNTGCKKSSDDRNDYYWEYAPDVMVFSCGCKAEIWATKGLLDKTKANVLGMKIFKDHSGNTLRVS